ncbi:MAG: hypothetical protein EOM21_15945 [Gammaproteobacteria bacterium]|nr:hypothetical protein [Gammaproteobacteria bacterium]
MTTHRPFVLMAEQFVNIIRLGDEMMMEEWVEEMADNVLMIKEVDRTLFGLFRDASIVCLPKEPEGTPWYCGEFEEFFSYLEEVPHVQAIVFPLLGILASQCITEEV